MKTRKEIKAEWHKKRRDERKQIETQLHIIFIMNIYEMGELDSQRGMTMAHP